MEKSIYSQEYSLFLEQLRNAREIKGLTQTQVAERLGQTQSFVSKVERGERRIDIVELRAFCSAIGVAFGVFVSQIDTALDSQK
jgi:transcriptional regulator with XRE-family HTH domain